MKKLFYLLFLVTALNSYAQKNFYINNAYNRNILKLNVLGLPTGMLSLKYERILLDKNKTLNVGVSYMFKRNVPYLDMLKGYIESDISFATWNNTKVATFSVIPEIRFYFTDVDAVGFYVAPFVRYDHYQADINLHYQYYDTSQSIQLSGPLASFGVGVGIGKQWKLNNNWYFDVNANVAYHTNSGTFSKKIPLTFEQQHYIKQQLDNFGIKNATMTTDVNAYGASVTAKANLLIPRATISFGRRF
ncbi:DUF3575 domain-containing protein [Flavobacterium sp. xlx-214]|uniref:DUF3575 domain-containing protein n=1 Tax=unclassified Flavobacterium TaxID=196869 RepID=UPI0013D70DB0|nr:MULTISPECIES: DUF3575 domain-containing protein [unclassified Flavobacterium]MBA5792202.1 DUF3575 domain-containing protein [Flavobacterium sp. xlx-221]QMI84445.1 DUF3575 domain-containing protein [Flavobacterium sp. xlx-214]